MFDIVPPSSSSNESEPQRYVPVGPRVVNVAWKLPARLRRPVSQEMRRQKVSPVKQVGFTKRPLYKSAASEPKTKEKSISLSPPPYVGNFSQAKKPVRPKQKVVAAAPVPQPRAPQKPSSSLAALGIGERDIAYDWGAAKDSEVTYQPETFVQPEENEIKEIWRVSFWPFSKKKLNLRN